MNEDAAVLGGANVINLVAVAVKARGVRCKFLDTGEPVTLRPKRQVWREVPGQILSVKPSKDWTYAGTRYLSGEVLSSRTEIAKLNLVPLALNSFATWDPREEYWGEPGEEINPYQLAVIQAGPRPCFEMEQVIPGEDPEDCWEDPITRAADCHECGDEEGARKILADVLTKDLRCIDAHVHLGNWDFNRETTYLDSIKRALQHYEIGVLIAELTLGRDFKSVLLWGLIDNRPYLRCLHGYGLCHWRLGDHVAARAIFDRMLWLNPPDNQGIRFILAAIDKGVSWDEFKD